MQIFCVFFLMDLRSKRCHFFLGASVAFCFLFQYPSVDQVLRELTLAIQGTLYVVPFPLLFSDGRRVFSQPSMADFFAALFPDGGKG